MTRKKFVKLLMAEGYSRNCANLMARKVAAQGVSYQKAYDALTGMCRLVKKLGKAFVPVREAAIKIGKAFAEVVRAVQPVYTMVKALEAYKSGMDAYDERHGIKPKK